MVDLRKLIAFAWLMAGAQLALVTSAMLGVSFALPLPLGLASMIFWPVIFIQAVRNFKWRGCWLLLPAPFCMWPVLLALVALIASPHVNS